MFCLYACVFGPIFLVVNGFEARLFEGWEADIDAVERASSFEVMVLVTILVVIASVKFTLDMSFQIFEVYKVLEGTGKSQHNDE